MAITINETTLGAAVKPGDDKITLASGVGVARGQLGYIDRECVRFQAPVPPVPATPVSWYVFRGWQGTAAQAHNSGAKIKTGEAAHFQLYSPAGAAVAGTQIAVPWINVQTGDVFDINAGAWRQIGFDGVAQGTPAWP
jgi:hypothetical protein